MPSRRTPPSRRSASCSPPTRPPRGSTCSAIATASSMSRFRSRRPAWSSGTDASIVTANERRRCSSSTSCRGRVAGGSPGILEADLQFLRLVADKVADDQGRPRQAPGRCSSAQVEEAMLGRRTAIDDGPLEPRRARASSQLARLERDLREEIARLREQLEESRVELGLNPGTVERITRVGLELGRQPPLAPTTSAAPKARRSPVSRSGELAGSWARAIADVPHPVTDRPRPIVFDHDAVDGHDDVVLAHLGHPLVPQASRLLRAEIWTQNPSYPARPRESRRRGLRCAARDRARAPRHHECPGASAA